MDKEFFNKFLYLNIDELKFICDKFQIPYYIYYKYDNKTVKSSYIEPKMNLIKRIKYFLIKNKIKPAKIIDENLVNFDDIPKNLSENDYIYFGQYKNGSTIIYNLMNKLTNNKFHFGALSCFLIRELFFRNKLITYKKFAKLYLKYLNKNIKHPEWQYINFKGNNWKEYRLNIKDYIFKFI